MKTKQIERKCKTCKCINYDNYKAVNAVVCYELKQIDGKKVAIRITPNRKACEKYREVKENAI